MTIRYKIICWLFHRLSKKEQNELRKYFVFLKNIHILNESISMFVAKNPPLMYVYKTYDEFNKYFKPDKKKEKFDFRALIGKIMFCSIIGHWWGNWCLGERCCYVCGKVQTIDEFCSLEKKEQNND